MYPLALNEDALDRILRQLKRFIKARVQSANVRGAVVALSGGIDSSVVAALAHDVVNTKALILPERGAVSYTHLRAHETVLDLVCRLLLEKKKKKKKNHI